ncbi:MAG: hypothetical protein AB7E96_12080 [Deferribacterales bacterium]
MAKKVPTDETTVKLVDIAELGKDLPSWKMAGVCAMKGWKAGKQVSETEWSAAVKQFDERQMGGGKK